MTVEPSTAPVARPRPVRRAPTDLPFTFADRTLADALSAERAEPDWLRAERIAAFEAFEALPIEPNQLYTTYLDLRNADLALARPYVRTARAPNPIASTKLPEGVAGLIDIREDGVAGLVLEPAAIAAGVVLETFGTALARDPDGLRAELDGGHGLPDDDKLAALARGFWSQGIRLQVPAGVRLERPIIMRWSVGVAERALIGRTLISLGDGARASILEELGPSGIIPPGAGQSLLASTLEVVLGRDARLEIASLQELPPSTIAIQYRNAVVGEGATLHWALAHLGSRLVRSRVDNRLEGDRSAVEQVEIVFGGEDQLFDLTSYTRHVGRDTTGNLLSKGALLDKARSFMKGMIVIDRTAIGTDSFLGEFGMNLSKQTRSVAIPSLEIDQPDCRRAAHSSSVGPIDETQLFYLESRGIPADEARKFIVLGFLEPVVARVPLADARDRLRERLEEKWDAGTGAGATAAASRRIDLLGVDEVPDGTMKMAFVDGTDQVLVVNTGGEFTATQGVCSHEYFELDKGFLTAGTLTCALHLSRFDLSNGEPLDPPAEEPLAVYPVVIEGGRIVIEVPDGPLEVNE